MNDGRIDVVMQSRYVGNLSRELRKDQRRIAAFQRMLSKRPLLIPVQLDIKGAVAQARLLNEEIRKEFAKGSRSILNPQGQSARASLLGSAASAGNLETVVSRRGKNTYTRTTDQIAPGVTRTTNFKGGKQVGVTERDITNVRQFADMLRDETKKFRRNYQEAGARRNTTGQIAAVRGQIDAIGGQGGILARAASAGLEGSSVYDKGQRRLDTLRETLSRLEGRTATEAERATRDSQTRRFERREKLHARRTDKRLDDVDVELTKAKAIEDRLQREQEINRVLAKRRAILESNKRFYQRLDSHSQRAGRGDLGDRAFRRTLGAANKLDQHDKDAAKLGVQQDKKDMAERRAARKLELERMIDDEVAATRRRIAEVKSEERKAKAEARTATQRSEASGRAATERQRIYQGSAARLGGIEALAGSEGHGKTAHRARNAGHSAVRQSIDQMNRFTAATRSSGHALDFHSSKLLRNAATFARWYGPMQVVLGTMRAITAGFEGMSNVDRQFATLQAVFRGTAKEAQGLKEGVLDLAVANGRSADEAMDAAIRFSRLGLTRVQVIKAVETALMAANVAEVDAAYAAEKLSAIYATYKLTVDDLPVVLNRLNAISNRYNVTNKDLLEGITRVAAMAKTVGLELRDLEGLIGATVGATGRPGQEIGTALRFAITKTSRPESVQNLKDTFDFDMTRPTGEMKGYLEILEDLSTLYPTLNSYEKQRLLDMTAGARQSAKFATILENFNQAQALTVEASLDSTSALDENRRIADSLQGQLQSLASEWTALWAAVGDTGALDAVSQTIYSLTEQIGQLTEAARSKRADGSQPVEDRSTRALLGTLLGDQAPFTVSKRYRSRGEIEQAIRNAEELRDTDNRIIHGGDDSRFYGFRRNDGRGFTSTDGRSIKLEDGESWDDVIAQLKSLISGQEANNLEALRERASGIPRLADGFDRIIRQIEGGNTSREANSKDFEAFARGIRTLPGGGDLFAENYTEIRKALMSGDNATAADGIRKFSNLARQSSPEAVTQFQKAREDHVAALTKDLEKAEDKIAGIAAKFGETEDAAERSSLSQQLGEAQAEAEALKDSLQAASQEINELSHAGIASFARLEQWFSRMRGELELMNQFREKTLAGDGAPLERRILTRRQGIRGPLNALRALRSETQGKHDAALGGISIEGGSMSDEEKVLSRRATQYDEILSKIDEEIRKESEAVRLAEKKLATEEALMRAKTGIDAGRKLAGNLATSLGVGLDDTARNVNTFRGLNTMGGRLMGSAGILTAGSAESSATLGQLLEMESRMGSIVGGLEGRRAGIYAQRGNLHFDEEKQRRDLIRRQQDSFLRNQVSRQVRVTGLGMRGSGTESEQMGRELQGQLGALGALRESPAAADREGKIRQEVEYTERRQRAEELVFSLMERESRLLADKAQLEGTIAEEQKRQTEEASKRLALADRESQLRAAALARTVNEGGRLGLDEFFYLSQDSRQAASSFLPGAMPTELQGEDANGSKRRQRIQKELDQLQTILPKLGSALETIGSELAERFNSDLRELGEGFAEQRKELTDELGRINAALPSFRKNLEDFSSNLTRLSGNGGPLSLPNRPLESAPDLTQPKPVPSELTVEQVNVSVNLNRQFEEIVRTVVVMKIEASERRILDFIRSTRPPDTSGTNSAVE